MNLIVKRTLRGFWFSEENKQLLQSFDSSFPCGHHCVSHSKNLAISEYIFLDKDYSSFV